MSDEQTPLDPGKSEGLTPLDPTYNQNLEDMVQIPREKLKAILKQAKEDKRKRELYEIVVLGMTQLQNELLPIENMKMKDLTSLSGWMKLAPKMIKVFDKVSSEKDFFAQKYRPLLDAITELRELSQDVYPQTLLDLFIPESQKQLSNGSK